MNNLKQQINIHNAQLGKDLSTIDYVIVPREYLSILIDGVLCLIYEECGKDVEKHHEIMTYLEEIKETT